MSLAQGLQIREQRKARQESAKQRNQELERLGYRFDESGNMFIREHSAAEAEQLQAKEAVQLARSLQNKLAAQETDKAFEDFAYTGDASFLQNALDSDPQLKQAWGERGVQMVGNIDFDNDSDLLNSSGLSSSYYDTDEKKEIIKKSLYKVYDGKDWSIGVANNAIAETGTLKRMGKRRAQPILENQESFVNLLKSPKVSPHTAEGHKYEKEILAASEETGVPANLIAAMIAKESSGNMNAVSSVRGKDYTGLMQVGEEAATEVGITDRNASPATNILAGARYLSKMIDKYGGDIPKALAAYNAGPGNVDKYNGIPPFGETQDYVKTILSNFDRGEQYYNRSADNTINTILEHRRAIANAEKGTTNKNVDRAVDQTDRSLDLKAKDQQIEILKTHTKMLTEGSTTKQKDLKAAEDKTVTLLSEFGGEEDFYNTDFTDPKNYRKAYPLVNAIEQLEGTDLSEQDKKNITDIRQLVALGDPASKLTSDQTGLLDSNLKELQKYFQTSVKGTSAKSAYAAFRNSVRNALFGSALTESEIKAFNEAYGTLGQKIGPVLETFETSLAQVQAKLDSTANLMNPLSAKVRLGADQDKLIQIREALQARIDYIKGLKSGTIIPGQTINKDRPSLDSIFKE